MLPGACEILDSAVIKLSSWSPRWPVKPIDCWVWRMRLLKTPPGRELDVLLSTGEQVTIALLVAWHCKRSASARVL